MRVQGWASSNTGWQGYVENEALPKIGVDRNQLGGKIRLYWALMFLVVALSAGVLGFTGVAVAAAGIAKVLFVVFLVLFLVSLVAHLGSGRRSLN